jgi:hypothetical protein
MSDDNYVVNLDRILGVVRREVLIANKKFPPLNSRHEGYAVLKEEVDELWDEIKTDKPIRAHSEAIQVAAMAVRFLCDLYGPPPMDKA